MVKNRVRVTTAAVLLSAEKYLNIWVVVVMMQVMSVFKFRVGMLVKIGRKEGIFRDG